MSVWSDGVIDVLLGCCCEFDCINTKVMNVTYLIEFNRDDAIFVSGAMLRDGLQFSLGCSLFKFEILVIRLPTVTASRHLIHVLSIKFTPFEPKEISHIDLNKSEQTTPSAV